MKSTAYSDGFEAGLVNDRDNPIPIWLPFSYMAWNAGNGVGVRIHCEVVEKIYLEFPH